MKCYVHVVTAQDRFKSEKLENVLINAYTCTTYLVIESSSDVIKMAQQSEKTFLLFVIPDLPKYKSFPS